MTSPAHSGPAPGRGLDPGAVACCLGALACWSAGPLFIHYLTGHIDAGTQNALRYSMATLIWLPLLLRTVGRGRWRAIPWRRALIPWVPNVLMQSAWALCFYYASPTLIVLLTKTNVLWIAGLSIALFPDERALARSRRFWFGLVLSLVGVAGVVTGRGDLTGGASGLGILVALATGLFGAGYALAIRVAFARTDSRLGFATVALYTAPALWAVALLGGHPGRCLDMGLGPWMAVILSGVTAIALGHVLFYAAIRRMGATLPALVNLAQPFTVLLGCRLVFGETLGGVQVLFGLLLVVGAGSAILAQRDLARPPR